MGKWNKKVLQVKVDKFADKVQVKKKAAVKKNMARKKKNTDSRKKAERATKKAKGDKENAMHLASESNKIGERKQKAGLAISENIKVIEKMVNSEGPDAADDRSTAVAMLAKLRVAKAHSDGTLPGLSKSQLKLPCLVSLHAAIKLATGDPSEKNLKRAKRRVLKATECGKMEKKKKIDEKNYKVKNKEKMDERRKK